MRDEEGKQSDDERPAYGILIEGYWWIVLLVLGVIVGFAARMPALWQR